MTPYDLLCDDNTKEVPGSDGNLYERFVGVVKGKKVYEMWYMDDVSLAEALNHLKLDLYILDKRKKA